MSVRDGLKSAQLGVREFQSKVLPVFLVSVILAFQLCISIPRLNLPFLDTRLHWYFDNAFFLLMAVHSNDKTINDSRKIFGVSRYEYNELLEPVKIQYYSNHGVLGPTLHLQFARLIGFKEYTPRLFSLLLSLFSTIFLFFMIRGVVDGNIVAFILTLLYVSMPLQLMYMDQMKYSNTEAVLFFAFLFFYSRLDTLRFAPVGVLISSFLLFHTDYPIFLPTLAIATYMMIRKERFKENIRWFYTMLPITIFAGIITTWLVQWWLGFEPGKIAEAISFRMGFDQADLTVAKWLQKQWAFLLENFGEVHLFLMSICLIWIVRRPSLLKNFWAYSGIVTFVCTILYLTAFKNQSFIHHFLQWHLVTGYVLMLVGLAQIYGWNHTLRRNRSLLFLAIPLFILNFHQDYVLYKKCRIPEFGKPQDLDAIQEIDKRILYFVDGTSGPPEWWNGPGIMLYKDPIYTGKKTPFPEAISETTSVRLDRDLLVTINDQKAISFVSESIKAWYPNFGMEPVHRSPSFTFFRLSFIPSQ